MTSLHRSPLIWALFLGAALYAVPLETSLAQLGESEEPLADAPPPMCWVGLDEFDRTSDLGEAMTFIRRAMLHPDPELLGYLGARLTTLIGDDPVKAKRVLMAASLTQNEDEMRLLMGALGNAAAASDPALLDPLLKAAENDLESLYGGLALQTIKHQPALGDAALKRVSALAYEPVGNNAVLAIATLGDVMNTAHLEHGEATDRYLDSLLEMAEAPALELSKNQLALEMPSHSDPIYTPAQTTRIAAMMHSALEPEMRVNASHLLGAQGNSDALREEFQRAFASEKSFCVRYLMSIQIARALGPDIVPFLEWAVGIDSRFALDLEDYRAIYASGEVDFDRVYLRKPFRFPTCQGHIDWEAE